MFNFSDKQTINKKKCLLFYRRFKSFLNLKPKQSAFKLSYPILLILISATLSSKSFANQDTEYSVAQTLINNHQRLSHWVHQHLEIALEKRIIANINGFRQILSNSDLDSDHWGLPGAVIAAPSVEFDQTRTNPNTGELGEWQDYRGVWKRDAAITMRMIFRLLSHGPWSHRSFAFKIAIIKNYANFSETEQGAHRQRIPIDWGGPGDAMMITNPLIEPHFDLAKAKVNAFAQPNLRQWGEPQDDGPPLQIIAFLDALTVLDEISHQSIMNDSMAATQLQIHRIIRRNLRFIMQTLPLTLNFERSYFERWEETRAQSHFAVLLEQRYALSHLLNQFSQKMNVAQFYKFFGYTTDEIKKIIQNIEHHIQTHHLSQNIILAHFQIDHNQGLVRNKASGLDVQVLMASLETNKSIDPVSQHYLAPSHPLMRSTFFELDQTFKINIELIKIA